MKKIVILALSINPEILKSHFISSFFQYMVSTGEVQKDLIVEAFVYTQGFTYEIESDCSLGGVPRLNIVRDDTMFNKGYTISEVRDYFTNKVINETQCDYFFHCDDDFKFREFSMKYLLNDFNYMEDHPEVGITNMHHKLGSQEEYPDYYYNFNPSRVATRSGILVRKDAFVSWGSEDKVRYFEECVLATYAYQKGYQIKHSISDIIHKTKSTGLGQSLEIKYGKRYIPQSGRQILHEKGLLIPSFDKEGNPKYENPCSISDKLEQEHLENCQKLSS